MSDNFGVGYIFARRTDIATPTPSYFGICQSLDFSHDQAIVELMGQFKLPVDVAGGKLTIGGKISFARIQAQMANDIFFGMSTGVTSGTGRQISVVVNGLPESHAAAASVTVTQAATFAEDLGVQYQATGISLVRVVSAPTVGQYAVNESTGVYTFNASETGTLYFFYEYTVTTQKEIAIVNTLMGPLPTFEMHWQNYYVTANGTTVTLHRKWNACKGKKLDEKLKNDGFTMTDFEFTVFAAQDGTVGTYDYSE